MLGDRDVLGGVEDYAGDAVLGLVRIQSTQVQRLHRLEGAGHAPVLLVRPPGG